MDSSVKRYLRYYSAPVLNAFAVILLFCNAQLVNLLFAGTYVVSSFFVFRKKNKLSFFIIDWLVIGILTIEMIAFFFNNPGTHAKTNLLGLFFNATIYLILRNSLKKNKQEILFTNVLAGFVILLAILTIGSFYFFKFNIEYEGFTNLVNFKSMFTPLGFLLNDWATILLLACAFVLLALIRTQHNTPWVWVLLAGLGVILMSIILSFSRGAYTSIAVGLFVFVSMGLAFKLMRVKKMLFFCACSILLITLTILPEHKAFMVTSGMTGTVSQQRSTEGRLRLWNASLQVFKQHPITGVGQGNFSLYANPCLAKKEDATFTGRATNSYLQLLVEKGIAGFIPWFVFVGLLLFSLLKMIRQKNKNSLPALIIFAILAAVMFRELSFSTFFETTQMQLLFFVLAALTVNHDKQENRKYTIPAYLLFCILSILLIVCVAIQVRSQIATKKNNAFIEKYQEGNYREALQNISQAIRFDPNNPLLNANKGFLLSLIGSDSAYIAGNETALKYYRIAITHSPFDPYLHHNLAYCFFIEGKRDSADIHFRKACELSANTALFHISRGLFQQKTETADWGLNEFKQAFRLSPDILDSEFSNEIKNKNQEWFKNMVQELTDSLEVKTNSKNSPILQSRLAKIILTEEDTLKAMHLFEKAVTQLPNLDRPWYYQGMVKLEQNDTISFLKYLNRATMLDPLDYRYPLALGDYYYSRKKTNDAIYYYKTALVNRANLYTQHAMIVPKWYGYKTLPNTVLPQNLLSLISPAFNREKVCSKLCELYNNLGKINEANSIEKYKNEKITINQLLKELNTKNLKL